MPYAIYSPEDFPKRDKGVWTDYRTAYGVTLQLVAHTWTELEELGYKKTTFANWVDGAGDGRETFISSKEVAERICRDAGREFNGQWIPVGIVACNTDKVDEKARKELVEKAEAQNKEFRRQVINSFELEFRAKSMGQPGRVIPTEYEKECYDLLGMTPPELVARPKEAPAPQVIVQQPDPAYIAMLVQQELAKLQKPVKTI